MVEAVLWHGHVGMPMELVFIDDVTADRSSRMNSDMLRAKISAQIQPNAAKLKGQSFKVQMDNDPKHPGKATQDVLNAKKWNIFQWPNQLSDLNPTEWAFPFLKTKLRAERPTKQVSTEGGSSNDLAYENSSFY